MTTKDLRMNLGAIQWGGWANNKGVSTFVNDTSLDSPGAPDYDSMITCIEKDGQITHVGFHITNVFSTGTNAGGYEIAIKTMSGGGVPTTTNYGGSSGTVFTISDFSIGWNWVELSTPATGSAGDIACLILTTIAADGSNYIQTPNYTVGGNITSYSSTPRRRALGGNTNQHPIFAYQYNDGDTFGLPLTQFFSNSYDSADSPDEVGAKFQVPVQMRCIGGIISNEPTSSSCPFTVTLYNNADAVVASTSVSDSDDVFYGTDQGYVFVAYWDAVELTPDQDYRLVITPDSSSLLVNVGGVTFTTGTYRSCIPEGERWMRTYRTDGGAWTDDEFSIPWMGLAIDQITYETGGNGNGAASSNTGTYYGWA